MAIASSLNQTVRLARLSQTRVIRRPVGHLPLLLRNVVPTCGVGFERHGQSRLRTGYPNQTNLTNSRSMQQRPASATTTSSRTLPFGSIVRTFQRCAQRPAERIDLELAAMMLLRSHRVIVRVLQKRTSQDDQGENNVVALTAPLTHSGTWKNSGRTVSKIT
jgi:hypothetical protein